MFRCVSGMGWTERPKLYSGHLNGLGFAVHAKQVGKSVHFSAVKIRIFTDQIEAYLPGAADGHAKRKKFAALQELLSAILRQPTEAEAASNCIDRSFDRTYGQEPLRWAARLALNGARTPSFDHDQHVLHHIDP